MLNLTEIQDTVFDHLEAALPMKLYEEAIPDADSVKKEKATGKIIPYVALQFGDLQDRISGRSFSGVRGNDYELPIYVQVVAAVPRTARRIASDNILDAMLGFSTDWSGEVRKRPGGGMWPIVNSNGATEAYLFPSSWAVTVQIHETP